MFGRLFVVIIAAHVTICFTCCWPKTHEELVYSMGGSIEMGKGTVFTSTVKVSVDGDKNISNLDGNIIRNGKEISKRIILDFGKTKTNYTILDGECMKRPLSKNMPKPCTPAGAVKSCCQNGFLGGLTDSLNFDVYAVLNTSKFTAVTAKDCFPALTWAGDGTTYNSVTIHTNFTVGIKDPSVFNIPKACSSVLLNKDEHMNWNKNIFNAMP